MSTFETEFPHFSTFSVRVAEVGLLTFETRFPHFSTFPVRVAEVGLSTFETGFLHFSTFPVSALHSSATSILADSPSVVDMYPDADHNLTLRIYIPLLRKLSMIIDLLQDLSPLHNLKLFGRLI